MRTGGRAEQETALPSWVVQTVVHGTLELDVQGPLHDGRWPPPPFRVNPEPLETNLCSAHCRSVPTQRPPARRPALPPEDAWGCAWPPAARPWSCCPRSTGSDAGADRLLAGRPRLCDCAYCRASSSVSVGISFQKFKFASIPVFIRVFCVGIPCKKSLERKELQLQTKSDCPSFLPGPLP